MPWSGSAPNMTFTRTDGTRSGDNTWAQAAAAPVNIEAPDHDVHDTDLKDGINACLKKDGGNTATADIPMGGFTLTNISAAGARTEPARFSDVQDNKGQYVATVGGTADAITLTPSIAIGAYAAGQRFTFVAGGTNTGATTVNISGLGAKSIVRPDGSNTALSVGDIVSGTLVDIEYDGTRFQLLLWRAEVVFDTSPLLGGDLDTNSFDIKFDNNKGIRDDSGNEQLIFGKVASAVNNIKINNNSTGGNPLIEAIGDDTNIGITLSGKGTGALRASSPVDLPHNSSPGNPGSSVGRLYAQSHDGVTTLSFRHSDGTVILLKPATQSNMETGTDVDRFVSPGRQHFHPGHPKAGGNFNGQGTPAFRSGDYGMGAITDNGTGDYSLAFDTAFADTNYWLGGFCRSTNNNQAAAVSAEDTDPKTTSSLSVLTAICSGSAGKTDNSEIGVTIWGDYA